MPPSAVYRPVSWLIHHGLPLKYCRALQDAGYSTIPEVNDVVRCWEYDDAPGTDQPLHRWLDVGQIGERAAGQLLAALGAWRDGEDRFPQNYPSERVAHQYCQAVRAGAVLHGQSLGGVGRFAAGNGLSDKAAGTALNLLVAAGYAAWVKAPCHDRDATMANLQRATPVAIDPEIVYSLAWDDSIPDTTRALCLEAADLLRHNVAMPVRDRLGRVLTRALDGLGRVEFDDGAHVMRVLDASDARPWFPMNGSHLSRRLPAVVV